MEAASAHSRNVCGSVIKIHHGVVQLFLQGFLLAIRKASIAGLDKVMVKGGVGPLWRADGHNGEVKVFNGVGGDRGGYGILLPIFIGLTYKSSCSNEANRHNSNPNDLG